MSKLFCTFVPKETIELYIKDLFSKYSIINDKIFIYEIKENDQEVIFIYNLETANTKYIPVNTISIHRKKEYNAFYTINALNALIINLTGKLDFNYEIDWNNYRNCLLITPQNKLKICNINRINYN